MAAASFRAALGEALQFPARDGYRLAGTLFRASDPQGSVLVGSAMGVPRKLYARFAAFLAEGGLTTLTFDYRGIGGSREGRLRALGGSLVTWAEQDLAGAADELARCAPAAKISYFAHSVGGQLMGFLQDPPFCAALFVGSQSGYWRLWDGWRRPAMWTVWHVLIPTLSPLFGYLPMRALRQGEDLPAGVALEWARWGRHPDYLGVGVRERGAAGFARFRGPLRSDAIADDGFAPPRSVQALLDHYSGAQKELRVQRPSALGVRSVGHFGCFRPTFESTLWRDWRGWLREER